MLDTPVRPLLSCLYGLLAALVLFATLALLRVDAREPEHIIRPGREASVQQLLRPVAERGFAGLAMAGIRLERAELRVFLRAPGDAPQAAQAERCEGPDWLRSPGALRLSFTPGRQLPSVANSRVADGLELTWYLCGPQSPGSPSPGADALAEEGAALARALAERHRGDIWEPRRERNEQGEVEVGLLTPASRALGLPARALVLASWASALLLSLVMGVALARAGPTAASSAARAPTRAWLLATLIVAVGLALRIALAARLPFDVDEIWAVPGRTPVLNADHDLWLHPPLYRAAQQFYAGAIGWREGQALWILRLPSIAFAGLTLALLAVSALRATRSSWALAPIALLACAPALARDSVLARPYSLAALLVVCVLTALAAREPDAQEPAGTVARRWALALLSLTLAAWTDLVAGLGAALVCALAWFEQRRAWPARELRLWAPAILGLALSLGVLIPGGLAALSGPASAPVGRDAASLLTAPAVIMSFAATGLEHASVALAIVCGAGLLALAALGARAGRALTAAPLLATAFALALALAVPTRPRNFLFIPALTAFALALAMTTTRARRRGSAQDAGRPAIENSK